MEIVEKKAWDILPNETRNAYNAFSIYLNMPIADPDPKKRRSYENLRVILGYNRKGTIEVWARKYQWIERARAHDISMGVKLEERRLATLDDFQRATIQSTSTQIVGLNSVIDGAISGLRKRIEEGEAVKGVDIKHLVDALMVKDNLMRRIARMPINYRSENVEEQDLDEDDAVFILGGKE